MACPWYELSHVWQSGSLLAENLRNDATGEFALHSNKSTYGAGGGPAVLSADRGWVGRIGPLAVEGRRGSC